MFSLSGNVHEWFRSKFKEWSQRVSVQDILSDVLSLLCGVLQGSVLGPVIFAIYIRLLDSLLGGLELAITSMLMTHSCTCHLILAMSQKFPHHRIIRLWMIQNLLKLNNDKTYIIYLSSSRHAKSLKTPGLQIYWVVYHSQWFSERPRSYLW